MSNTHTSIHENFIRAILANKAIATAYFRNYLPEHISSKLDFSTLPRYLTRIFRSSFVNQFLTLYFLVRKMTLPATLKFAC